jgi:hypothetical protein
MATKKKAVKKSAPKKKAAPRGKKIKSPQTFKLSIGGDVEKNPSINVEIKADNTTLVAGLVACYLKDTRMREILGKVAILILESEKKRIEKELRTFNKN